MSAASSATPARRAWVIASLAVLALLLAPIAAALGATQTYAGQAGGPTPDIERTGLALFLPGGGLAPGESAGTINTVVDGVARVGYCVDAERVLSTGTETVTVTPAPATHANRAIAWILVNRTPAGAPTAEKAQQAAAAQVAVLLLRAELDAARPTDDDALNAAAAALRDEALAATASPATLTATATATAPGGRDVVVALRGPAGATVTLSATGGTPVAPTVVLDAAGAGQAVVRAAGPGTVTVTATAPGDATLVQVDPQRERQSTVFAVPATLTVTATAAVTDTTTPSTVSTPGPGVPLGTVTQTPRAPRLAITKVGPRTARVGGVVRYVIRVTNRGSAAARNVRVTERLPRGLVIARRNYTVLRGGAPVWVVGTLRPGQSRTVVVTLRAADGLTGTRVNAAVATGTGIVPVTARAATTFRQGVPRVQPAVTG